MYGLFLHWTLVLDVVPQEAEFSRWLGWYFRPLVCLYVACVGICEWSVGSRQRNGSCQFYKGLNSQVPESHFIDNISLIVLIRASHRSAQMEGGNQEIVTYREGGQEL